LTHQATLLTSDTFLSEYGPFIIDAGS
jgi:hypothetical protein